MTCRPVLVLLLLAGTGSVIAEDPPALVLIDGTPVAGAVRTVSGGNVTLDAGGKPYRLEDLRALNLPAKDSPAEVTRNIRVDLHGGGAVWADALWLADDQLTMDWSFEDRLTIPVEAVRAMLFEPNREVPGVEVKNIRDDDRVYVRVGGEIQAVEGLVESIDADNLNMQWKKKSRKLARGQVYAVALAELGAADKPARFTAALADGSRVPCVSFTLDKSFLVMQLAESELKLPRSVVQSIQVLSDKILFLSTQTPIAEESKPLLAPRRAWRRDLSVEGKPLTLGGKTFSRGLGMAGGQRLRFTVPERFVRFHAVIGIDDETDRRGDCEFAVLGDGKELFRRRVRGVDPAADINIELNGAREITLLVDPGEDLDLADHADWCEACLIRD